MCLSCYKKLRREIRKNNCDKTDNVEIPCKSCEVNHTLISAPFGIKLESAKQLQKCSATDCTVELPPADENELITRNIIVQINQCMETGIWFGNSGTNDESNEIKTARKELQVSYLTQALEGLNWLRRFNKEGTDQRVDYWRVWNRAHYSRAIVEGNTSLANRLLEAYPSLMKVIKLYLDHPDLAEDMKPSVLHRHLNPLKDDKLFHELGGIHTGITRFVATQDLSKPPLMLNYLNDIRWVLPNEELASKYHTQTLRSNSECATELTSSISEKLLVGKECHIYQSAHDRITNFYYLFRVKNVVFKLYAARFDLQHRELKLETVSEVARLAAKRAEENIVSIY